MSRRHRSLVARSVFGVLAGLALWCAAPLVADSAQRAAKPSAPAAQRKPPKKGNAPAEVPLETHGPGRRTPGGSQQPDQISPGIADGHAQPFRGR